MTHLSRRALLRLDDPGEKGGRRRKHLEHLLTCRTCQEKRARISEIRQLASEVTSPSAPDTFAAVLRQLDEGPPVILPVPTTEPLERKKRPWRAVASAVVLVAVVASAAAAAVTLHRFGLIGRPATSDAPVVVPSSSDRLDMEMTVATSGLTVILESRDQEVQVQIQVENRPLLRLTVEGGIDSRIRTGAARVTVSMTSGGRLALRVPRGASPVRFVANGSTVVTVREGTIRTPGHAVAEELDEPLSVLLARARDRDGGGA